MKLTKLDRRTLLLPLAVLGASAFGALVLMITAPPVESVAPEQTFPPVRVAEVHPETLRVAVHTQGTVAPRTESDLVPEVSGTVVWVSPSLVSGGFFEADEPLLRIDRRDYEATLARARAAVARAKGEWEHASAELERRESLSKRDIASPSQLSDARRAARVGEANLADARVAFQQARRDLERTELRAPYSGRVREERVDVGQFASRGAPLASLYATDLAEIRLPVPDDQLAYLDLPALGARDGDELPGPPVTLRARFAGAEHTWQGRVMRTEGEIDPRSRMVHVVARVEDPYAAGDGGRPPLAVGLFVQAEILGRELRDVLVVPRASLRDDTQLMVVDAEDRLRLRPAEVVRIERDRALVRAELGPDERVCVSNLQAPVEGMRVRPMAAGGTGRS